MTTPNRLSKGEVIVGSLDVDEGISTTNHVDFDTANGSTGAIGRLTWNDTDGTLDLGLKGGNVTLQIGQEAHVRVYNNTENAMTDGQVVRLNGTAGSYRVAVALAQATSEGASAETLGVVTEPIAKNAEGFVTTYGFVRDINTTGLTEGAIVWLSPTTAGGMTTTKPTAPQHLVMIGVCLRSNANNGVLFVNVHNGYELAELHDVAITNPQDGHVLRYDGTTGVWRNVAP